MIARSEEEFEKFQQMDIQRRREDAALGAERKPRLMEQNELPPFLLEDDDEIEEEVTEEILGRGNRNRNDTKYDDQMSEREWLKAIGVGQIYIEVRLEQNNLCNFVSLCIIRKFYFIF